MHTCEYTNVITKLGLEHQGATHEVLGGAFVITLVDPEAGGHAGSLCMYIAPKDFLGKIPEPTGKSLLDCVYAGYPYALRKFYDDNK